MGCTPPFINAGASSTTVKMYTDTAVMPMPNINAATAVMISIMIRLPPLMVNSSDVNLVPAPVIAMDPTRMPMPVQRGIIGIMPRAESSRAEMSFSSVSLLSFLKKLTITNAARVYIIDVSAEY